MGTKPTPKRSPFDVLPTDLEDANQKALFWWARFCGARGLEAANDPLSYSVQGHADRYSTRPIPELRYNFFAIPNGAMFGKDAAERKRIGAKMKGQGLTNGIPDTMLAAPRGNWAGLFVELKRPGETLSLDQETIHPHLSSHHYLVKVAFGWLEAREILTTYLEI